MKLTQKVVHNSCQNSSNYITVCSVCAFGCGFYYEIDPSSESSHLRLKMCQNVSYSIALISKAENSLALKGWLIENKI